jgi:hypothetical protein
LDTPLGVEVAADGAILIADSSMIAFGASIRQRTSSRRSPARSKGSAGDGGTPDTRS